MSPAWYVTINRRDNVRFQFDTKVNELDTI